jgi:hypothetical protein
MTQDTSKARRLAHVGASRHRRSDYASDVHAKPCHANAVDADCRNGRNGAVCLTRPWSRLVRQRVVQIRRGGHGAHRRRNPEPQPRLTGPRMQTSGPSAAAGLGEARGWRNRACRFVVRRFCVRRQAQGPRQVGEPERDCAFRIGAVIRALLPHSTDVQGDVDARLVAAVCSPVRQCAASQREGCVSSIPRLRIAMNDVPASRKMR